MIRRGERGDLTAVAAIQAESPEAAQWDTGGYLELDFWVAAGPAGIAGFLVGRTVASGERELLNLAVDRRERRRGVARGLLQAWLEGSEGTVFLEVRESNEAAQKFYKSMGFHEVSLRRNYYANPLEAAIVMKFHSC
jgi:[ribosomal protein S18]-alanine N-acetyltransferase